jgi:hypothetical protein
MKTVGVLCCLGNDEQKSFCVQSGQNFKNTMDLWLDESMRVESMDNRASLYERYHMYTSWKY